MIRKTFMLIGIFIAIAGVGARAGVTVHFEGKLKDSSAQETVIRLAKREAVRRGWRVVSGDLSKVSIKRVINEKDIPYEGPLKGVIIYPHAMCEPIYIQFDSSLFMQDFVKTQFAGPDIHIKVIEFFRAIEPHFSSFNIYDESEYWEKSNRALLEQNMNAVLIQMESIQRSHPSVRGPIKLPSGRIADLIE